MLKFQERAATKEWIDIANGFFIEARKNPLRSEAAMAAFKLIQRLILVSVSQEDAIYRSSKVPHSIDKRGIAFVDYSGSLRLFAEFRRLKFKNNLTRVR
mgnify:CR=1 FL=1